MGLIINDKIKKFMVGYPTVSDKYNVAGAILSGSSAVKFGDPLMWDSGAQNGDGYYVKKAASTVTAANFAGFVLATNVKLADGFPGTTVETAPGEAVNLLKKVRKIEIRTKALSHQIFAGEYHSAFKGRGMAFSEVREYQYGDDVRNMDWNVTARLRAPYVKVFEEEREMTVMLLVDISRSGLFGTVGETKRDMLAEIAAVLSFSAILNNDKVGALFFSDHVEEFIPPRKGRSHLLHIIREMLDLQPKSSGTNIGEALRFLTNAIKQKCTAFLLSDMMDTDADGNPRYEDAMKVAVNRHDLSVIKVYDPRERTIPDVGLVNVKDSETGRTAWVNTSSAKVRRMFSEAVEKSDEKALKMMRKYQIDSVEIPTGSDYVKSLKALFDKR